MTPTYFTTISRARLVWYFFLLIVFLVYTMHLIELIVPDVSAEVFQYLHTHLRLTHHTGSTPVGSPVCPPRKANRPCALRKRATNWDPAIYASFEREKVHRAYSHEEKLCQTEVFGFLSNEEGGGRRNGACLHHAQTSLFSPHLRPTNTQLGCCLNTWSRVTPGLTAWLGVSHRH